MCAGECGGGVCVAKVLREALPADLINYIAALSLSLSLSHTRARTHAHTHTHTTCVQQQIVESPRVLLQFVTDCPCSVSGCFRPAASLSPS